MNNEEKGLQKNNINLLITNYPRIVEISDKIRNLKKINDYEFKSIAIGTENYDIHLDALHPRRFTCTCSLANGKRIN